MNPPTQTKIDLPEVRALLLHLAAERGLAENSLRAYRRDLENINDWLTDHGKNLLTGSPADFQRYLQEQTVTGKSTCTVTRRVATIRVFLRFLMSDAKHAVRCSSIMQQLERPKKAKPLPKILSRDQVVRLIKAPDPKSRTYWRDVAMLELLYAAGLRASELCDLELNHVNLDVGCVRALGKGMKERIVPLGKPAIEAMRQYLMLCRPGLVKKPSDMLFLSRTGRPLDRNALWRFIEKQAKRSGLYGRVSPHVLRHCFATHLIGGGADLRVVQELLGHSDISTTEVYTHVDSSRLKGVHHKFHPRG
jgi:integrase/recombinase XerD